MIKLLKNNFKHHPIISNLHVLNKIEKQVAILYCLGWGYKEIAEDRNIKYTYVLVIKQNIVKKLRKQFKRKNIKREFPNKIYLYSKPYLGIKSFDEEKIGE